MRLLSFIVALALTVALITALNIQVGSIPPIGKFISPQQGFWQNAEPSDKNFNADLSFPYIDKRAQVYFDARMVPHVFAQSEKDAYFIQGYLHAKFRLWQMEFQTFAAAGRLTEVLGAGPDSAYLNNDRYMRRLGMVFGAKHSLAEMEKDDETHRAMDSYTAGVNYFIEQLTVSDLPVEYRLLNYVPEKWTNLKIALLQQYMSFELTGGENDIELTNARSFFSQEDFNKLYPLFQDSAMPVIPKGTVYPPASVHPVIPAGADTAYFFKKDTVLVTGPKPDPHNGSNNWAVAGSKTRSRRPILCNDPHLGLNLPSLWYEMQISTPVSNSYGVSFPGAPAIIIGFNDSIAWGVTNASRDVKDYYRIQFKDERKAQYLFNKEWKDANLIVETFLMKDGSSVYDTVSYTVFGPVLYDNHFNGKGRTGIDENLAVRWRAHDPSNPLKAFILLNTAKNYNDYLQALPYFTCPGQNFIFAGKSGDIAIWHQGNFPAKWNMQGDFIMPGTDSAYNWQASIPQSENPHVFNPSAGYVCSANQLPADTTYPYYQGGYYDVYRAISINRFLSRMSNITPGDMQHLQTENYNAFAATAMPVLSAHIAEGELSEAERQYLQLVTSWNFRNDNDEPGVAIFISWFDEIEKLVWNDELSKVKGRTLQPPSYTLIEALLKDTAFSFIDNINTQQKETLTEVVTQAFKNVVPALIAANNEGRLKWNKYKDTQIRHLLRLQPFSRLHVNTGGGENVINATQATHGPSWRMIVQLTDKTEAYGIYPGGQSGNPGSKFYDTFIDNWAAGKYYSLWVMKKGDVQNSKIRYVINVSKE